LITQYLVPLSYPDPGSNIAILGIAHIIENKQIYNIKQCSIAYYKY